LLKIARDADIINQMQLVLVLNYSSQKSWNWSCYKMALLCNYAFKL